MAFYQFTRKQFIPTTLRELWQFVASPQNLKKITPDHMGFEIMNGNPSEEMYPGMIISYKLSPIPGIKMTWVTEITHVESNRYFIDVQRAGPYSFWHHQHLFEEGDGGVWMTDIVSYIPPMGPIGALANSLYIRTQLNKIFDYREVALKELFN